MEPTLAQIAEAYSDFYKAVNGIRPRWITGWSKDDYAKAWQALEREADEEFLEQGRRCLAAQRTFEKEVAELLALGAADRATAIRWWFESNGYKPYEDSEPFSRYEVQNLEGVLWDRGFEMGNWPFILREFFPNYVGGSFIRDDLTYEECTETKCVYVPTVAELQAMAA